MANHFVSTFFGGTVWRKVEGSVHAVLQLGPHTFLPVRLEQGNLGPAKPYWVEELAGVVAFKTEQEAWEFLENWLNG